MAKGRVVIYCRNRAEALRAARECNGRAYRADWTEVTED